MFIKSISRKSKGFTRPAKKASITDCILANQSTHRISDSGEHVVKTELPSHPKRLGNILLSSEDCFKHLPVLGCITATPPLQIASAFPAAQHIFFLLI